MIIGILQTGHAPEELQATHGDYSRMFARLFEGHDFTYRVFNVVDMEFPEALDQADAWLITGSKHGVYEDHPWIAPLEALIRDIRDAGAPMVGICFGHQIIARALGGKVVKFPGGWSVGRRSYWIEGEEYPLNAWHQDQVVELPEGAEVLGHSDFCENAVIAYGDRILTVQPHPEFGAEIIAGLIEHRGKGVVPDPLLDAARAALDEPTANRRMADRLAAVLNLARVTA